MKKFFSISFIMLMGILYVNAQPCTPNPNLTTPGLYPDTTTNLPVGAETQPYQAVIYAVIPADTQLYGNTVHIDSIGVLGIIGLPSGFNYSCGRPTCYILGGTQGCIVIFGTPAVGQAGTYPLGIRILGKANFNGMPISMPDTITGYKIVIKDQSHAGLENMANSIISVYPNPAYDMLHIEFYSHTEQNGSLSINDLQGKNVITRQISFIPGFQVISLPIEGLNNGIYLIKVETGTSVLYNKVFVRH
ncbi:MAG: T9SS type A sorting domain-containing protein [Bacteroidales bacterium]|nr:T9SS type A sorting domain-containing protein [Bacteroidales bacterium]